VIHPTAIIHAQAVLDPTVEVGPYAVIEASVTVGPHCHVGAHTCLMRGSTIGAHNTFHTGCVIGDAPQDLKYKGESTGLRIGDDNVFREHVTIHRSNKAGEETIIGSHNFLMVNSHVGHNATLGNHVIMANGALLAGHVTVADRVFISGNCLAHQFVRIGTLALMQGGSAISKDLPPYTIARGDNGICGLNTVGLRRAGFSSTQRAELKRLYRVLFRDGMTRRGAIAKARAGFTSDAAKILIEFIASARRGVCTDTGREADDEEQSGEE
jgi:UDP-N-acetylglucosamine acyltransferase